MEALSEILKLCNFTGMKHEQELHQRSHLPSVVSNTIKTKPPASSSKGYKHNIFKHLQTSQQLSRTEFTSAMCNVKVCQSLFKDNTQQLRTATESVWESLSTRPLHYAENTHQPVPHRFLQHAHNLNICTPPTCKFKPARLSLVFFVFSYIPTGEGVYSMQCYYRKGLGFVWWVLDWLFSSRKAVRILFPFFFTSRPSTYLCYVTCLTCGMESIEVMTAITSYIES